MGTEPSAVIDGTRMTKSQLTEAIELAETVDPGSGAEAVGDLVSVEDDGWSDGDIQVYDDTGDQLLHRTTVPNLQTALSAVMGTTVRLDGTDITMDQAEEALELAESVDNGSGRMLVGETVAVEDDGYGDAERDIRLVENNTEISDRIIRYVSPSRIEDAIESARGNCPGPIEQDTWDTISKYGPADPKLLGLDDTFGHHLVLDGGGDVWLVEPDGSLHDTGGPVMTTSVIEQLADEVLDD